MHLYCKKFDYNQKTPTNQTVTENVKDNKHFVLNIYKSKVKGRPNLIVEHVYSSIKK